jgi:hypothetical protein
MAMIANSYIAGASSTNSRQRKTIQASRGGEVAEATLEAWMYLERKGFLTPRLGDGIHGWLDLSRRAKKAANRKRSGSLKFSNQLPWDHSHFP